MFYIKEQSLFYIMQKKIKEMLIIYLNINDCVSVPLKEHYDDS